MKEKFRMITFSEKSHNYSFLRKKSELIDFQKADWTFTAFWIKSGVCAAASYYIKYNLECAIKSYPVSLKLICIHIE